MTRRRRPSRMHAPARVPAPPYLADTPETREDLARYYDAIARMDAQIGEMMAELGRRRLRDSTLVVFLSDNGAPFPREKGTLYDSGTRTPLIFSWPAVIRAGSVYDRGLVSTVDLAPTLLELAGRTRAGGDAGPELPRAPRRARVVRRPRPYVFSERNWHDCDEHQRAVRTDPLQADPHRRLHRAAALHRGRHRGQPLVPRSPRARPDRPPHRGAAAAVRGAARPARAVRPAQRDPWELTNVADDPAYAATVRELAAVLQAWIERDRRLPGGLPGARRQHRPDHRGAVHHEDPAAPEPGAAARGGAVGRAGPDLSPRTPAAAPAPAMIWTSSYEQPAGRRRRRILRRSAGRAG